MKFKLGNYQKLLLKIPFIISSLHTEAKVTKLQTPSPQSLRPWVVGKGWSSLTPPTVACTGDLCSGFLGHFFLHYPMLLWICFEILSYSKTWRSGKSTCLYKSFQIPSEAHRWDRNWNRRSCLCAGRLLFLNKFKSILMISCFFAPSFFCLISNLWSSDADFYALMSLSICRTS